ncbi:MAG: hypothetical protein Q4G59_10730, partial [Planctomycetia bacterium]|nr:hypothetical protein [Planctomycetia bacterium]
MKKIIVSFCLFWSLAVCGIIAAQETPKPFTLPDPNEAATLAALLADPARSLYDKTLACKVVARQGTAASVPVLAKYLEDPELAHPAWIALLQIPGDQARLALCNAIKVAKNVKYVPGLIRTLGQRREPVSIATVVPFLSNENTDIFAAACDAMTLLASRETLEPLVKAWKSAPVERLPYLAAPLFACATRCLDANKLDDAMAVYTLIVHTKGITSVTRSKATQGMIVTSQGAARTDLFAKALSSADQQIFLAAAQTLPLIDRDSLAKILVAKFDEVSKERQLILLDMMKQLRHPSNRDFVYKLATTTG